MEDIYQDDYSSAAGHDRLKFLPTAVRRGVSAVVFLSLVGGLGLWSYRLGSRDAREVPVIQAMQGPARVQPDDPGGMKAAHQGQELNSVLEGTGAPVARQTAEATPVPVSLTEEDGPQGDLLMAAPAQLVADVLAEAAAQGGLNPTPSEANGNFVESSGNDGETSIEVASIADDPVSLTGFRPRSRSSALGAAKASSGTVQNTAREVSNVSSGARLVQLGAFDSEAITRETWASLVSKNRDLLENKSLYIERTTNNARVFYRLRVAGFQSSSETRDMCQALRARQIDCIPVTLQ